MPDVVNAATRSRMMAGIRGVDTTPERLIRSLLHRNGFRFTLHANDLPGKPDIVLPKYGAVIFVHGCFWHGHQCHMFKWPKSNSAFWRKKIEANSRRDTVNYQALRDANWRLLVIWECVLKGKDRCNEAGVSAALQTWLSSGAAASELTPQLREQS